MTYYGGRVFASYAEKKVHIQNLEKLKEAPSVKTDAYIDDCIKVRGHLESFCDEHHASLLDNLKENTPLSFLDLFARH